MDQITPSMTYGLTALTVAIYSIPLLFVIWRVTKTSIRPYQDLGFGFSRYARISFFDAVDRRAHPR